MANDRSIDVINFLRAARPWSIAQARALIERLDDKTLVKLYNRAYDWAGKKDVLAQEGYNDVLGDTPFEEVIGIARLAALPGPKADEVIAEEMKKQGRSRRKHQAIKKSIEDNRRQKTI